MEPIKLVNKLPQIPFHDAEIRVRKQTERYPLMGAVRSPDGERDKTIVFVASAELPDEVA